MRRPSTYALLLLAALFVLAQPCLLSAAEVSGTVISVDLQKRELVLGDMHGRRSTFQVSRSARVIINNRPGTFAELGAGDTVRMTYEASDKHLLATEINAMQM